MLNLFGKKLLFFLSALLLLSLPCLQLPADSIEVIRKLQKNLKEQQEILTEDKIELEKDKKLLDEREKELIKKSKELDDREKELIAEREELKEDKSLLESLKSFYQSLSSSLKAEYSKGFFHGVLIAIPISFVGGGAVGFKLGVEIRLP